MSPATSAPLPPALFPPPTQAATGKMQVLLFSLGTREIFGINVFKVREVKRTPAISRSPNMPHGIEGVISLRGDIIPVVNLPDLAQPGVHQSSNEAIMVTEFNGHTQACMLHDVDRIVRIDWNKVLPPATLLHGTHELVTAVAELPDGQWASILDVEQLLAGVFGEAAPPELAPLDGGPYHAFYADDSVIARRKIAQVLDGLGIRHQHATRGREAWDKLRAMAAAAQAEGIPLRERMQLILLDGEMPEMDGFTLAHAIKSDRRFEGIRVVMLSALATDANRLMGKEVGCDAYVRKFDVELLADTLCGFLSTLGKKH